MNEAIKDLVEFAVSDKSPKNKIVKLNIISKKEAKTIQLKTDLEVEGFQRIIDKSAINHTLRFHGNEKKEASRGQIAVTLYDFLLIPEIVKTDNIFYAGKNKLGNDCILYQANFETIYFYVEEIRTGRKQLALQSMYKRKKKK